jgi:hypothetical protein
MAGFGWLAEDEISGLLAVPQLAASGGRMMLDAGCGWFAVIDGTRVAF